MTNAYVTISSTSTITDGRRLPVLMETWRRWKPQPEVYTGVDGDTVVSSGTDSTKWRWSFTGLAYKTTTTTSDALVEGAGQTVEGWFTAKTGKMTDVYGTTWDIVWEGDFRPVEWTGGVNGTSERLKVEVRLRQS